MKKNVIRIGDTVRVLRPKWVKRVGYPLVWTDLLEEVRSDPRSAEALKVLEISTAELTNEKISHFVRAVALARVEQRGFGGNERSLHYMKMGGEDDSILDVIGLDCVPCHGHVGTEFEVLGKRIVKTGKRFAPWSGRSGPDYEYDYEPGGLENCKTHILLRTYAGEIEACDVEKV